MTSQDKTPAIKTRSKIKPLQEEITSLKHENESLLEEMYDKGIRTRPTMMTQIEDREAETLSVIKFSISECEKKTGRKFPSYLAEYVKISDLYPAS